MFLMREETLMKETIKNGKKETTKIDWKRALRHPVMFLKDLYPFILSHHPSCGKFDDHVFTVRGVKFCIGCFTSFPAFFIAFAIGYFTGWGEYVSIGIGLLLMSLLATPYLLYKGLKLRSKGFNMFSKASFGVAFAVYSFIVLNYFPNITIAFLLVFYTGSLLTAIINLKRVVEMENICKKCPMYKDFPRCDGFMDIIEKLERDSFLVKK